MIFKLKAWAEIALDHTQGEPTSKHVATDFRLDFPGYVEPDHFKDPKTGLPNAAGAKAITQCFVQGLVANMFVADKDGYWNRNEHLEYIISELQRGYAREGKLTIINPKT